MSSINNFNTIINNMKEKSIKFSKKISKGIDNKKRRDFVSEMVYGLLASSSCYLSNIARSLKEEITLKATEKRLSRNLDEFNNGKEYTSTYEDVRNKILLDNYVEEVRNKIDENTVFCFDPGDIGKKYAEKLENIDTIKDGSTGEYIQGYNTIEVVGLTKNEKQPIPVYTRVFSTKEEKFISTSKEYIEAIKYLNKKFGKKGVYALDRWFDDQKYFYEFVKLGLEFVIRMKEIRKVANAKSGIEENIKRKAKRVKMKSSYTYKDKKGITRTAHTGYMKITIAEVPGEVFYLVVIKSEEFPKDPMMLLTNMKPGKDDFTKMVNKVYIRRWKVEEYFRFKKQEFGFEKELLVRSLNSIRTLNMLLTVVIGFIAMFSDKQNQVQYKIVFKASESLRKNEDITLVFYAVARGLKEIFRFNLKGLRNKKEKIKVGIEGQISLL